MSAAAVVAASVLAALYHACGAVIVSGHPHFLHPFARGPAGVAGFAPVEVEGPDAAPGVVLAGGPPHGPAVPSFPGNAAAAVLSEP